MADELTASERLNAQAAEYAVRGEVQFERRRLRVYVAGPMSNDLFDGVQRGIAVGRQMFLDGLAPFVPHFDALFFLPDGNWNAYLEYDLEYISVCDAVYRLEGDSKGADLEVEHATALGIPYFLEGHHQEGYQSLLQYAKNRNLAGVRNAVA